MNATRCGTVWALWARIARYGPKETLTDETGISLPRHVWGFVGTSRDLSERLPEYVAFCRVDTLRFSLDPRAIVGICRDLSAFWGRGSKHPSQAPDSSSCTRAGHGQDHPFGLPSLCSRNLDRRSLAEWFRQLEFSPGREIFIFFLIPRMSPVSNLAISCRPGIFFLRLPSFSRRCTPWAVPAL